MSNLRQAAQQALEALEEFCEAGTMLRPMERREALRTALAMHQAQEQAEPVAKYSDIVSDGGLDPRNKFDIAPPQQAEPVHGDIRALKYRIHELEGEVMGYRRMLDVAEAAPQRKPLTIEEINALPEAKGYWPIGMNDRIVRLIRAIEAAHNIKEGA